ncbi:MAG: tetratricopeptide repeat protein [Bacteroidales bacterium]|nr:tetratricopeptide repeat protein [Bacteroidales bacterium]
MGRKNISALLLLALALMATACGTKKVSPTESDATRLEALDLQIQRHPRRAELLAERGQLLVKMGRAKEGLDDLRQAVKLKPEEVDYLMALADAYFANGNTDQSYSTLSQAEQLAPNRTDVHLKMGEITYVRRDFDRSLRSLSRVTEVEPNNRVALYMKASIYKEKGDTAEAVTLFRRVSDLYPDYAPAYEELGTLYATRDIDLATDYLTTALRLDSTNTNTMYALALCHQTAGRMEDAEALYHRLLERNPKSADALHNLGYIELFHYKDYPRAIDYFTQALEADGGHTAAWVNRGIAHELAGHTTEARRDYQAALDLDPDFTPAIEGLNRTK